MKLADEADLVVIGTPSAPRTVSGTDGAVVDMLFGVAVEKVGKGRPPARLDVRIHGGEVAGGEYLLLEHEPEVVAGQRAAFYLARRPDGTFRPIRGEHGVIPERMATTAGEARNPEFESDPTEASIADDATACDPNPPAENGYSGWVQKRHPATGATLTVNGNAYAFNWSFFNMGGYVGGLDEGRAAWNGAGGTASISNLGSTVIDPRQDQNDGFNVVAWGQTTSSTAVAQAWSFVTTDGRITGADIVFDVDYQSQITYTTGSIAADRYDFTSIAVHEFGHVLGFGHITDGAQVMYGCVSTGQARRTVAWGDLSGHRNLYPGTDVGYYLVDESGAVFGLGGAGSRGQTMAPYYGGANQSNVLGYPTNKLTDIEVYRPSRKGYWQLASNGGVFAWGAAPFKGSAAGVLCGGCTAPDMATTSSGNGYWVLGSDGGVFAFGDAPFRGSAAGIMPAGAYAVGIAAAPNNNGYWVTNNLGQIYAFNVPYRGGGLPSGSQPARSIQGSTGGDGYWILGNDGGIFAYGDAPFLGSAPGAGSVRKLSRHPSQNMYHFVNSPGGVYQSSNMPFLGRGTTGTPYSATAITYRPADPPPPPPPDFWMSASPSRITVRRGESGTATISLGANSTFNGVVTMSVSGQPSGTAASVNPSSVSLTANTGQASTLTVTVDLTYVGASSFRITVTGFGGGLTRSTSVDVDVPLA